MAQIIYGDLEVKGRLLSLKVEEVTSLPTVDAEQAGRLVFFENELYVNTGSEYAPIQISNSTSQPLIETLGNNWFNEDLSFDPTDFNDEFDHVSGLSSTDTLFDVLKQLDSAISNVEITELEQIEEFSFDNLTEGEVIVWDGSNFVNFGATEWLQNYAEINIEDLENFAKSVEYANYQMIIYSGTGFTNKPWYYTHNSVVNSQTHIVTHNLNQRYCLVSVINKTTNQSIGSDEYVIIFDNQNRLSITLDEPALIVAVVVGVTID